MSEENVLIPKARYEKMLARLARNTGVDEEEKPPPGAGESPGTETDHSITGAPNTHQDGAPSSNTNTESDTEGGRTYDQIVQENEDLTPPGITPDSIQKKKKKKKSIKQNVVTFMKKTKKGAAQTRKVPSKGKGTVKTKWLTL
jgi:hypothetical protein